MKPAKEIPEIPCPKCGARPLEPCKDESGNELVGDPNRPEVIFLHPERVLQREVFDKSASKREDVNQAAARIVREATKE